MLTNNPFADLALIVPSFVMQFFVVSMLLLVVLSTALDMLHKKNVVYFFRNAKKAKKSAKIDLSVGKKTAAKKLGEQAANSLVWLSRYHVTKKYSWNM